MAPDDLTTDPVDEADDATDKDPDEVEPTLSEPTADNDDDSGDES